MMTEPDVTTCTPLDGALALARLGYHVIPIDGAQRFPRGLEDWPSEATTDPDTITAWWTGKYRDRGVGITTGHRSGVWVVDVDVKEGKQGKESLAALETQWGNLPRTVTAKTATGGLHLYFRWDPDKVVRNFQESPNSTYFPLGRGIDIRGHNGFVVAPPTVNPSHGPYRWIPGRDPWAMIPAEAPAWLYELVLPPVEDPPSPTPTPLPPIVGGNDEDSPADLVRRNHNWHDELERDGWTRGRNNRGDTYWTRPGKNPRDGHSAVLHEPDGPLVIFTSDVPPGLANVGKPTTDGSGRSVSLFDYVAAYRHNGDRAALAREIRRSQPSTGLQKLSGGIRSLTVPQPTSEPEEAPEEAPAESGPMNLPNEFWEARPELQHIRLAAWSRLLSPDAVFGVVLARVSAATHPAICIPSIIGAPASLSCYTALTGPPGTGKSTSISAAADLIPITSPKVTQGGQLGSGEGLVELYIREKQVDDEDGKKKTIRVHDMTGAFVTLDEGAALAELGARKGSTVLSILRSMWTGGAIGQSNASKDTTRSLRGGGYTLGFVIGIQPSLAGALLSDDAAGTPQRFLWARTTDPLIPADPIPWPGRLDWTPPVRRGEFGAELQIDDWIAREIRSAALARNRGEVVIDALDAHADLLRLKVAGLLAVLNRRQEVTIEDWTLAELVVDTSAAVRADVANTVRWEAAERSRAADQAAARRAVAAAAATSEHQLTEYERALDSAAKYAARRIAKDGTGTRRDIARAIASRDRRVVSIDEAIDHAITCGWIIQEDDGSFRQGAEIQ